MHSTVFLSFRKYLMEYLFLGGSATYATSFPAVVPRLPNVAIAVQQHNSAAAGRR